MEPLAWVEISVFGIGGIISLVGVLAMIIFKRIDQNIERMANSVGELNVKMAVIIERTDNHEKRIEKLESNSK